MSIKSEMIVIHLYLATQNPIILFRLLNKVHNFPIIGFSEVIKYLKEQGNKTFLLNLSLILLQPQTISWILIRKAVQDGSTLWVGRKSDARLNTISLSHIKSFHKTLTVQHFMRALHPHDHELL